MLTYTLEDARLFVETRFDEETWEVTEAVLATQTSLLVKNIDPVGLVVVGPSSAGKTTVLQFVDKDKEYAYNTDDVTPASFVSHNANKSEEELEEVDLLPQVRHKTLYIPDMGQWYNGPRDSVEKRMSRTARVMDGDGMTRNTGAHGKRGYIGDYRFNFVGASTPLPQRGWDVMGKLGNRFVFHEKQSSDESDKVMDDVFGNSEYSENLQEAQAAVTEFLDGLWDEFGGYNNVAWQSEPRDRIKKAIDDLAKIIQHGRAPITESGPQQEDRRRVATALRNIARGRALLDRRTAIETGDLAVLGRIALSTMHQKRRGIVRLLLDPQTDTTLVSAEVEDYLGLSRPTAHDRMELADKLGVGNELRDGNSDNSTRVISTRFNWPDIVPFPETYRLA